jgi:small subunit ribosomal protein S16
MGRRHRPFYRLNAVEKRTQRDGRVLESLGWYNPMAKDGQQRVDLKADAIKSWLERGAQPSETAMDLLVEHEVVDGEAWKKERERRRRRNYEKAVEKKKADDEAKRAAEEAAKAEAEAAKAEASSEAETPAEA